jgi:RNA polymerase sigma factor (sigma-70 family)
MLDAQDAEDTRLYKEGKFSDLLGKYEPIIVGRCLAALRGDDRAYDVAQEAMLRLHREFERGVDYGGVPYRVVVYQVTRWKLKEHWQRVRGEPVDPEPEVVEWTMIGDDVAARDWLARFFETLPERERRVLELWTLGFTAEEIARRLEMTANAVYQRLHHARRRFREALLDE